MLHEVNRAVISREENHDRLDHGRLNHGVMDMIVQFLRWDRAATERGCYGVILPIFYVVALTSDRLGFVFTRKLIGPHLP